MEFEIQFTDFAISETDSWNNLIQSNDSELKRNEIIPLDIGDGKI